MNNVSTIKNILKSHKAGELIFASKLYKEKLASSVSEAAFYKTLQRMCEADELISVSKGVYSIPKKSRYGVVPPSEQEIIETFTENNSGMIVGYAMYNELKLTTQVPKTINLVSALIESNFKSIKNIEIEQLPIEFTKKQKLMIQGLEVLQNFYSIQDINYTEFLKFAKKLALAFDQNVFDEIIAARKYKKSTISFYKEILDYYKVNNDLSRYLSTLSNYKHPTMEEIYELARAS